MVGAESSPMKDASISTAWGEEVLIHVWSIAQQGKENKGSVFSGVRVVMISLPYFVLKFPACSVQGYQKHPEGAAGLVQGSLVVHVEERAPLRGPSCALKQADVQGGVFL